MNKEDVIKIYKAIDMEKDKGNIKFRYALLKNGNIIKSEIETLIEIEKGIDKIIEPFNEERNELVKELGELDEKTNTYSIVDADKISEFNKRVKPIQEKYKDLISEHNEKYGEYKEMLKEDLEIPLSLYEVKIENCPDDLATESLEVFMKCEIIK